MTPEQQAIQSLQREIEMLRADFSNVHDTLFAYLGREDAAMQMALRHLDLWQLARAQHELLQEAVLGITTTADFLLRRDLLAERAKELGVAKEVQA